MKIAMAGITKTRRGEIPGLVITAETEFERELLKNYKTSGFGCKPPTLSAGWTVEGYGIEVNIDSEGLEETQHMKEDQEMGSDCK